MAMEGKTAACAHLSPVGNIAAATCDTWSNESVQNVRLLSGSAPEAFTELLAYGPAYEIEFDGFNAPTSNVNWKSIFQLIKQMQPNILIWAGPEIVHTGAIPDGLWIRISRIHMEYHPGVAGWDEGKLTSFLEGHGYACDRVPRSRHPGLGNLFAVRR